MRSFLTLIVSLLLLLPLEHLVAQSGAIGQINKPGNMGTEFYLTFLPCYEESGNNKLMIYIAATAEGTATIEIEGKGFSKKVTLKAFQVTPVELGAGFGQAFSKSVNGSIPPEQVYGKAAVHVVASTPVIIYGVTRFNYTSDSFLASPIESLGFEYVVSSMADMTWMYGGYSLPSETAIVAAYDSTRIEFRLGGPSVTETGGGMKPGDTKSFVMHKGDVWVIGNNANSKEGDMTGSYLKASKPVAVFSGNQCANVPTVTPWCDFIDEMESPIENWGKDYLVPKYKSRTYGYYSKVLAGDSVCAVTRNGIPWKSFTKVGGQEPSAWSFQRVDPSTNNIARLRSSSRFNVVLFNTGQSDDNVSTDPFQMNVVPFEQFTKSYFFCTPGSIRGIGFTRNFMGVIFPLTASDEVPDDLEFGVAQADTMYWRRFTSVFPTAVVASDKFEGTMSNGLQYAYRECILPSDNIYMLRCSKPIMVYSYGGSDYDSYGHPAGALSLDLGHLSDTKKPILEMRDGEPGLGGLVIDMPNNPSIRSNLSKIFLSAQSKNCILKADRIDGKNSSQLSWTISAADVNKECTAYLTAVDRAGNDTTFVLSIPPFVHIKNSGKDTLCVGSQVQLSVDARFKTYTWSTGETTSIITAWSDSATTKSYSATVVDSNGTSLKTTVYKITFVAAPSKPILQQTLNSLRVVDTDASLSYTWFKNGAVHCTACSSTIAINSSGRYQVQITDKHGCAVMSEPFDAIVANIDTEDDGHAIALSPNPVQSECVVEFTDKQRPSKMEVVSMKGEVLQSIVAELVSDKRHTIQCSSLSPGSYVLRMWFGNTVVLRKFVKQ